jgi:molecular chaperone DnaK
LKENEAKIKAEDKKEVEEKIEALKKVKDGEDVEAIKKAADELATTAQKVGGALYQDRPEAEVSGAGQASANTEEKKEEKPEDSKE